MRRSPFRISARTLALFCAAALAACSGHGGGGAIPPASGAFLTKPPSVSPASIAPAPMSSARPDAAAMANARPDSTLQSLGYSQLPGSAVQVASSADGTLWALSSAPAGPDKYIWKYANNAWSGISGQASQIAVAPNGTLYAINSGGGTWRYSSGAWTPLGGGASYITVGADGSVDVLSNGGAGPDRAIWQNKNNVWTQQPGSGTQLVASWDWGTYAAGSGTASPGGLYVINSVGAIYYLNTNGTYATLPGAAAALAPTTSGGVFALAYPGSAGGTEVYYYNYSDNSWTPQPGTGVGLSSNGQNLYVLSSSGGIYKAPVTPINSPAPSATLKPIEYASQSHPGWKYWGPWSSANAFQFPVQSGYNGTGETVAVIIDAVPSQSDMAYYLNLFQVTRTGQISSRPVDGGGLNPDTEGEATLDAETIAGISPGANLIIYNIPDLSNQHIVDAYNAVLSDGRANILSMSFGGCEGTSSKTIDHPIFDQMNTAGIAIVASSGDSGNACYFNGTTWPNGAQSPASDPNIIGVGGTETDPSTDTILSNAIWNDCAGSSKGDNCISSGNVSVQFTPPPYQVGLAGTVTSGRDVPDIAFPGDGVLIRWTGGNYAFGGTSWSAPLTAGLLAQIYQYCQVTSMPNAIKMFYNTFGAMGYTAFDDVTVGNNEYFDTIAPSYSAAAGYDLVGGIGQPLGMQVATHICPSRVFSPLDGGFRLAAAAVQQLPAEARVDDNRIDLRNVPGLTDLGVRAPDSQTRIAVAIRATASVHRDEAAVVSTLADAGFTIVQRWPNAGVVDVAAPASVVARYFGTTFHDYAQVGRGTRFANVAPLTIPASIAPYVQGVITDDLVMKSHGPLRKERV